MPTDGATALDRAVLARRHAVAEESRAREIRRDAEYQGACAQAERALHDAIEALFSPEEAATLCLHFERWPRHMDRTPPVYAIFHCETREFVLRLGEYEDDEPGLRVVATYGLQRSLVLPLDQPTGAYDRLIDYLACR